MRTYQENAEPTREVFRNTQYSTGIVKLATVIRCREQGKHGAVCKELVSVFNNLVRTHYQRTVMALQETAHNVTTKNIAHTAVILCPAMNSL